MKKIIIVLIGVLLLSSCKSKRATARTRTHTNTRHVSDRSTHTTNPSITKPAKNEPVKEISQIITQPQSQVVITQNTVYNEQIIADMYANQPLLDTRKIDYIKTYSQLAINEMEAYKIPASITLAQGLLESRYGQSELTKKSKNHFGIKCHKWSGQRVYHDDDAKGECFRKYNYDANSYRDHSLFLANGKRYSRLFTYAPNDYRSWAKGLRKAGYATDSRYPKKLIDLIEEYQLYTFDKFVLGDDYKPLIDVSVLEQPQETVHIVKAGETLYSISGKYFVPVNDIKRFNNLNTNNISVGQSLKLKGAPQIIPDYIEHIVKKGDTLYSLSKEYKVTIEKIKSLNNLGNNELSIGQLIIIE